jgi:uncharacterized lipoprotein
MRHTTSITAGIATAILLVAVLSACTTTPNYDQRFGDAVRQARLQMTLNPDANKNADPVAGLDGNAAKEGLTRYENTFKTPPPVTNVINIGRAVSGSGDK